ncbi:hypothetical protein [Streptodolium elevatio]|uniref:Secreted protein n=1 Tax=Streptodolium elevatio TaxID=3157996 RepID=A0ABV3DIF1_9ACTN
MTVSALVRPRRRLRRLVATTVMASAVAVGGALPAAADEAAESAAQRWTPAKLPAGAASLTGVTKPDAATTWVAGFRLVDEGGGLDFQPVVYEKNGGGRWTEIPTAPGESGRINAIASTSKKDAWVVGDQKGYDPGGPIMAQHWNGRSWKSVDVPTAPDSTGGGLLSVSAVGPNNVWAAGWTQIQDSVTPDPDGGPPQIETHSEGIVAHWDGRSWKNVRVPQPYPSWALNSISASGPNDVWAVGSGYGDDDQPVALHYNGSKWSVLPTPPHGGVYGEFNSVVAKSPTDVWAVGRVLLDDKDRGHALVMHWDGKAWTKVATPETAGPMYGAAPAPGGIVAAGKTNDRVNGYALRVVGNRASSLGIPTDLPEGRTYAPWAVATDPKTGKATIVGVIENPQGYPDPMVLTGRI